MGKEQAHIADLITPGISAVAVLKIENYSIKQDKQDTLSSPYQLK